MERKFVFIISLNRRTTFSLFRIWHNSENPSKQSDETERCDHSKGRPVTASTFRWQCQEFYLFNQFYFGFLPRLPLELCTHYKCLRDFLLRNFLGTKQKWLEISLSKIVMFACVCFLVPWQHFFPLHLLKPKNSRGKKRIKVLCVFADKYQQAGDWLRKFNLDKLESKTALNAFTFVHNYADNGDKYPANRDVSANWINPK